MNAFTIYAVNLDVAGGAGSDVLIDQVVQQELDTGLQEMLLAADGGVDPRYSAVASQELRARFTTTDLKAVLDKCGISGLNASGDSDETGVTLYCRKVAEGGTREADNAGNHVSLVMKNVLVVPRQITANHNDPSGATLSLEAIPWYDGTTAPVVTSATANLSGSPDITNTWGCGPVKLNNTLYNAGTVQGVTIDFGLDVVTLGGDHLPWPRMAYIRARRPSISIRILDVSLLHTFGIYGAAVSGTTAVYLRKNAEGATRVADGTGEHITVTVAEGRVSVGPLSGDQGGEMGAEIRITPTGATNILNISTTATVATS